MCGIIGSVSSSSLFLRAYAGLQALEYRGYDSFGFGSSFDNKLTLIKKVGALSDNNSQDFNALENATTLIGHTRWATHGEVSESNSHPHESSDGAIAIVHNGVISNFSELQQQYPHWSLKSTTDTEVASNVIAEYLEHKKDLLSSLQEAYHTLKGEFAICGVCKNHPNTLFAMKHKSPLLIGQIKDDPESFFIASDRVALAEFSDSMMISEIPDNVILLIQEGCLTVNQLVDGYWKSINLDQRLVSLKEAKDDGLGDFPHYMLKEISDSPSAIHSSVKELLPKKEVLLQAMMRTLLDRSSFSFTGSGSAYYVTLFAQYLFQKHARVQVATHPSDEYLNLRHFNKGDLLFAISQSGETFDTLEVFRQAKESGVTTIALNNVSYSSMQQLADIALFQNAGKETCVLSTKSIMSQLIVVYELAVSLGKERNIISSDQEQSLLNDIERLTQSIPTLIQELGPRLKSLAQQSSFIKNWFFIGRGIHYAVALENALKFKEVSYLHAEGMPAGFFKHGTISLIDDSFYTVAFFPHPHHEPELFQMTLDNVHEIKARGGKVIGFGNAISQSLKDYFIDYIELPDINNSLNALLQLTAGQLFAYYTALDLGCNIDKPRGLAKSVTVR